MILEPNCNKRKCKHFIGIINDGDETTERPACAAFRDGIPEEIAYGSDLHLKKIKTQTNDLVFEKEES